jgi:hypothetical protein
MANPALEQARDSVLRNGEPVSRERLIATEPLQPIRPDRPPLKTKNPGEGRCCRYIAVVSEAEAPVGVEPTMAEASGSPNQEGPSGPSPRHRPALWLPSYRKVPSPFSFDARKTRRSIHPRRRLRYVTGRGW